MMPLHTGQATKPCYEEETLTMMPLHRGQANKTVLRRGNSYQDAIT